MSPPMPMPTGCWFSAAIVAKGQVIAYAGQTGDVTSPQLHFEIRHGTTPVESAIAATCLHARRNRR